MCSWINLYLTTVSVYETERVLWKKKNCFATEYRIILVGVDQNQSRCLKGRPLDSSAQGYGFDSPPRRTKSRKRLIQNTPLIILGIELWVQSNLDITNTDISNSAQLEESIWIKNTFWLLSPTIIWRWIFFYKSKLPEVQINLHFG